MVDDKDIYRSAALLIRQHGEQAWTEATTRYFAMKEKGDEGGMDVWRRIARAINSLNEVIPTSLLN